MASVPGGADSRRAVLEALRRVKLPEVPLPEVESRVVPPADPRQAFADAFAAVGGACERVTAAGLAGAVRALAEKLGARRVAALAPGTGPSDVDLARLSDPHELEGIDLAVIPGVFGVAENGAVWVDARPLGRFRGVFVIAQHLALVVPGTAIVKDMHAAYERIAFDGGGFQLFIAGPSKTADIEQSLVIGAHGARSATALLVD